MNSFLENGKNTDLIRWSDDGNSFVVLDEDEFAKTLIPELFKHNNYASFVRQLNMYGFHKKVGLSDNSMKASERKNKTPSEYSNPYFRRGLPDLLWLIQKPKNATAGKKGKKAEAEQEDDVDEYVEETTPPPGRHSRPHPQLTLGNGDSTLSTEQVQSVQRELAAIRHQQTQITRMMGALRREHEQLYGQAATFQDQHARHENSINAILTFLATVYNRSLSGHEGVQNIQNMFANAIPHESSQSGTVVDVGDYQFPDLNPDGTAKSFKKPPLLLTDGQQGRISSMSPVSSTATYGQRPTRTSSQQTRPAQTARSPDVEELFDSTVNTPVAQAQPQLHNRNNSAQQDMLSVIQNSNARNSSAGTPAADFSNVLNSLENAGGNSPLTNSQRTDMLRMMNNSSRQGADSALVNSTPPPGPSHFDRQLANTKADLDNLAKLQAEQDKSVQNLTNLLQPLSPTGSIPGIHDGSSLPPPPLDIDDFLNHNEYFGEFPSEGGGNYDFNGSGDQNLSQSGLDYGGYNDDDELFGNLPPASSQQNGQADSGYDGYDGADDAKGRVESVASSEVTTPNTQNESPDGTDGVGPGTRAKGRKLSTIENGSSVPKRQRRS